MQCMQVTCDTGFTPMHFAAAYGHVHMIVLLNQFDPDLCQLVDQMGQTPLHVASQQENPNVVSLLLKIGSDPRALDRTGTTPLALSANSSQDVRRVLNQSIMPPVRDTLQFRFSVYKLTTSFFEMACPNCAHLILVHLIPRGCVQTISFDQESMNPVMQKTIEDLAKQFDEADAAFDELLADIHFGDDAVAEQSSSSSDSESSDTESDEDNPSSSNKSRRSSSSSSKVSWSGDDDDNASSTYTGVSQEDVDAQRDALAAAFGGKRAARKMKKFVSPAEARRKQAEEEAAEAAQVAEAAVSRNCPFHIAACCTSCLSSRSLSS